MFGNFETEHTLSKMYASDFYELKMVRKQNPIFVIVVFKANMNEIEQKQTTTLTMCYLKSTFILSLRPHVNVNPFTTAPSTQNTDNIANTRPLSASTTGWVRMKFTPCIMKLQDL